MAAKNHLSLDSIKHHENQHDNCVNSFDHYDPLSSLLGLLEIILSQLDLDQLHLESEVVKRYPDHDARDHQQDLQLFKLAAHNTKDWHEEVEKEGDETWVIDFDFQFY